MSSEHSDISTGAVDSIDRLPAGESFDSLLQGFRRRLDLQLEEWLAGKRDVLCDGVADGIELVGKLDEYVLRGGKRLRPALLYFAYRGCGGTAPLQVMPAAMAVELLHTYLLIHDDIMDRAETRRGAPSAHRIFREEHRQSGWRGSSEHHGEAVATLLGDLAHSYAEELFSSAAARGDTRALRQAFGAMCQEVIVGQYLEMTAPFRRGLEESDLLRILQMKSGRYSVERPIQLGALLAGADAATLAGLSAYGLSLGEAFQLQDDLLGMFGDPSEVGKPVSSDLVEGKFTVLIHHTLQAVGEDDRAHVESALGNANLSAEDADRVRGIIRDSGAERRVVEMIESRTALARRSLEELELNDEGRRFFGGLVRYMSERRT